MVIDCDRCRMRDVACRSCVVTVLLELPHAGRHVELDVVEARAISVLAGSGLVPPLRLVPTDQPYQADQLDQPDHAEQLDHPGRGDRAASDTYDDARGAGASRAG
ncbi:MAG: hypothetical protein ACLGIA_03230 [Actinomycetes bacterium]